MASKPKIAKKAAAPRKKGANGYKLPEPIPNGEILQDMSKKKWMIGPSIGMGGFGEIYSACEHNSTPKKPSLYPYVIKIEPHGNGPLFVEMHFYMRNAKKDDVSNFAKTNKLGMLGMPIYLGSGSHECNGEKYRFVVMERFGKDLWCKFLENGRLFPTHTVFRMAIQLIDVLQYIHGRTYVHADIKGANILFGTKKGTENQIYLVDFGLASHYTIKEFKYDPKKAHNGTIEYTSRDAHNGVPTRRGDMEILGYNLVQWLAGSLPWEVDLKSPTHVQAQKEKCMTDIPAFLRKTFIKSAPPHAIATYMQYVSEMEYDEAPDYKKCKQMFEMGLKTLGYSSTCNLDFTPTKPNIKPVKGKKTVSSDSEDSPDAEVKPKVLKKTLKTKKAPIKATVIEDVSVKESPAKRRSAVVNIDVLRNTIATQTSIEKPNLISPRRRVQKDEAVNSEGVRRTARNKSKDYNELGDSSTDVIDNSYTEAPTPKRLLKRKHVKKVEIEYCSDEEVVIQTTITKKRNNAIASKKTTPRKDEKKSWKSSPAIVNGKTTK